MRVNKYRTELTSDHLTTLVKERAVNYQVNYTAIDRPEAVRNVVNDVFKLNIQSEEYIYMLALDTKMKLIGIFEISHGTVNASVASPREIYMKALLCGAVNIILVHNHPSGEPAPSKEDIKITETIKQAGDIIGITLCDHIIVGEGDIYYSFKEQGGI